MAEHGSFIAQSRPPTFDFSGSISQQAPNDLPEIAELVLQVGEERRFSLQGYLIKTGPCSLIAVPRRLQEIGGGVDLLQHHNFKNSPFPEIFEDLDQAKATIKAWCWALAEDNAPIHR